MKKGIMPFPSSPSSEERPADAENSRAENSLHSLPSMGLPLMNSHPPDGKDPQALPESDSEDEFSSVKIEFSPRHSFSSIHGGESADFDELSDLKVEDQTHPTGDKKELVGHYQDPLWNDKNISHGSSKRISKEKSLIDFLQDISWSEVDPANRPSVPGGPSAADGKLNSNLSVQESCPKNADSESSNNERTENGNCSPQDGKKDKFTGCCSLSFLRSKQKAK